MEKVRAFIDREISFDFPVTALIGPNGGGKSTILGAAACAYKDIRPGLFFPKSAIGDDSMADWSIEYSAIDRTVNQRNDLRRGCRFRQQRWKRSEVLSRPVLYFGIERTVPAGEKPKFKKLMKSSYKHRGQQSELSKAVASQVEKILGKSVKKFHVTNIEGNERFHIGGDGKTEYSEFHFGAGESSIIRIVAAIEGTEKGALILVEEIENGLHPVATRRLVEYLIEVAKRRACQVIFTTHSDYALDPLPPEAIWASIDGSLQQGKLSITALRAISGRVDTKAVVFVEDEFAKNWLEIVLREELASDFEQIEIHQVAGDGNAKKVHLGHRGNPSLKSISFCFLDGDSKQEDDPSSGIFRLPGEQPERTIVEAVAENLDKDLAVLTVSCQRAPESQKMVKDAVTETLLTNRDPHLLFNQIGIKIGFVSEIIVRGAFIHLWMRSNPEEVKVLTEPLRKALKESE